MYLFSFSFAAFSELNEHAKNLFKPSNVFEFQDGAKQSSMEYFFLFQNIVKFCVPQEEILKR